MENLETPGVYDEIWSVSRERAEEYFRRNGTGGCRVTVTELEPNRVGSLCFPRAEIRIEGPAWEEEGRKFTAAFMSAGG